MIVAAILSFDGGSGLCLRLVMGAKSGNMLKLLHQMIEFSHFSFCIQPEKEIQKQKHQRISETNTLPHNI
jgi:hypothetical protein